MKNKRVEVEKWAYKFTNPTFMKFQPSEDFQQPEEKQKESIVNRLRTFFSPPSKPKLRTPVRRLNSIATEFKYSPRKTGQRNATLKYVKRLTNEHVLVGNEDQLDAMCVSGIIHDFVDTEYLWSLNIKRAFLHVAIDYKKNYIILLPEREVMVFQFDPKIIKTKPNFVSSIKLNKEVRFVQVVKDSTFILCYSNNFEVYTIEEGKGIRLTASKNYDLPGDNIKLLQIPQPYENILNIFFSEEIPNSKSISIWNIEVQFQPKDLKMSKPLKIYDVPGYQKKYLRLQNFSKDIYFINLGQQIFAVRKGYVIDSANVNIKSSSNNLKYIAHQKLIHISQFKVEVYNFSVDTSVNPPRIILNSTDSIQIPIKLEKYEYLDAVQLLGNNFAVFFQTKEEHSKVLNGEIKYGFLVTHLIKMEDKIKDILPQQIKNVSQQNIQEKADMVRKMGLQRKDIYLRLWNNSQKTSVEDFNILLDTHDYDTIKIEIEKKLKKTSMNFRQVLLLEQGCLSMLSENIFSINNNKQSIKNYFISHLLIRKLELYKEIAMFERNQKNQFNSKHEDEISPLLINIQNYNYYKTVDIKSMLFELISRHCNQEKNEAFKIRTILKFFKFSLRTVYEDIISEIIVATKRRFIKILETIPELLPFEPTFEIEVEDPALFEGVWSPISFQDWQKHLYIDTVSTIDNKSNLADVCSNVWYKRYWLTQHDYINYTKKEIQDKYDLIKSENIFYHTIEQVFENVKDYMSLKQIIDLIQDHYEQMPQHIYGKIFLYRKLFEHFKENQKINKIEEKVENFGDFLKLKDEDIFKAMFNYEKVKKGFILKEMKPLYLKLAGSEIFNQGLLNYFASHKSQISDIKYLLNRMNNEKKEFHEENAGIYEVLVRGMQLKLKLGSEEDIPIDEVLIYIENISLSSSNPIMKDLQIMRLINQESVRFKKIKLDMTIFDMTKNIDNVLAALVHYEIQQAKLLQIRDIEEIKALTYSIISNIQKLKDRIFADYKQKELILFVFLTNLLEKEELIHAVAILLEDEWINRQFTLNQLLIENLVLYMYKWKMNNQPSYLDGKSYLKDLVNLLPQENKCRQYIEAEIDIGQILSTENHHVLYPLSNGHEYFASMELQNLINNCQGEHLLSINIQKLHESVVKVQEISSNGELNPITLNSIYEMVILRLVECDMLRQVIDKIKSLIEIQGNTPINYIYPSLLVAKIAPQMIEENKNLLLRISSYLFFEPLKLLNVLNEIMNTRATSDEYKRLLLKYYLEVKVSMKNYSQNNPILEPLYLQILETDLEKKNYHKFIKQALFNLLSQKQQFSRNPEFNIIYIMFCNDPYVLIKYIYINKYIINIKDFRCFMSYLIRQNIFNKHMVLEFGKRLFFIIHQAITKNKNIEHIIEQYRSVPLYITREFERITETKSDFEVKLVKSLDRFKQKIKTVNADRERKKQKGILKTDEMRIKKFKERLQNFVKKDMQFEYPFPDSDDNPKTKEPNLKKQDKKVMEVIDPFDPKYERASLLDRTVKELGLYVSIEKQRHQRSLYYTQKFARDGIFGSLTIDKNIGALFSQGIENAIASSDSVRRSRKHMLRIGKAQTQYVNLTNFNSVQNITEKRSKAISNITEQVLDEIHKREESLVRQTKNPDVGNIFAETTIINQIIKDDMEINEKTTFDFSLLNPYKDNDKFLLFLKELIKITYNNGKLNFLDVLYFLKKLIQAYPILNINKQWIEIYLRAENLQNKFKLDLPLRDILILDGLYIDSEISDRLFSFLLPTIVSHLSEQNIAKICKVITLAFKKTELEQEILFNYLLELFHKYQRSIFSPGIDQSQIKMQREKMGMIIAKIHIRTLMARDEEMMRIFHEQETRKQIASIIVASFRKRYDSKSAEIFNEKWIRKMQSITAYEG